MFQKKPFVIAFGFLIKEISRCSKIGNNNTTRWFKVCHGSLRIPTDFQSIYFERQYVNR